MIITRSQEIHLICLVTGTLWQFWFHPAKRLSPATYLAEAGKKIDMLLKLAEK